jgi:catechol 2,3-dioxygenase-like lactoylglutathione lyase family enzyme
MGGKMKQVIGKGVLSLFKKIDHINIVVSDLEAAKNFFLALGFTIVKRHFLQGEWLDKAINLPNVIAEYIALAIPDTQTNLELIKFYRPEGSRDSHISMANQIGFRHMALEIKDIESVTAHLKKQGITFLSDIQTASNQKKSCYFLGPEGIILELAEYP